MNRRLVMTPAEACKAITDLCAYEYLKGKRKININRVWELAYAGLPENAPPDTHSIPIYYGGTDTTANTDNVPNGVIG